MLSTILALETIHLATQDQRTEKDQPYEPAEKNQNLPCLDPLGDDSIDKT